MDILLLGIVILGIGAVLFLAESKRELKRFRVTDYIVSGEKLTGLTREYRAVFLSDLHNKIYGEDNEQLIDAIRQSCPDLILIGGDMLIGKKDIPFDAALSLIRQLPAIAPVYYANGNHEQRMKEHPENYGDVYCRYRDSLIASGVRFLENESVSITFDECQIRISGFEAPLEVYKKFADPTDVKEILQDFFGAVSNDRYEILLAHNPAMEASYRGWGADLTLSGHLHGGIIRLPVLGGLITPQARVFPKYSGEYSQKGAHAMIVSKGLGTHTVNIRFCNPAELIVVHFCSPDS